MKIGVIGEPLVELSLPDEQGEILQRRPGGDSLNMAIYLARLLDRNRYRLSYLTRLGDDATSRWLTAELTAEGIDTGLIGIEAGGQPGLCQIENLADGDRRFAYWRSDTPARRMFHGQNRPPIASLDGFDMLIFSAVTLAILPPVARDILLQRVTALARAGKAVVFDTNYRPALWHSAGIARQWIERASDPATLLMPTTDDLRPLYDFNSSASLFHMLADRYQGDIVLKDGGHPVRTRIDGDSGIFHLDCSGPRVDTTGAGDSFNAGFIAARISGKTPEDAVAAGHRLASIVVAHRNAVIPISAMP
ncbi:MAG: sugar kinase [Rhodospirillales bacterium]